MNLNFSSTHSVFANAGGIIVPRTDGVPITTDALAARKFVTVNFHGR